MSSPHSYAHLGPFSDLVSFSSALPKSTHRHNHKGVSRQTILHALAFSPRIEKVQDLRLEQRWDCNGLRGELISYSVGFGPRSEAYVIHPKGRGPWPGVVALHDHGGFKYFGKEKISSGPVERTKNLEAYYKKYYGGRTYAEALAAHGFAVMVPDVFMWGSRKIPWDNIPESERRLGEMSAKLWPSLDFGHNIHRYNQSARFNENTLVKYCNVLGISLAGVIAYEDRLAAEYLFSRKDICNGNMGAIGLSGGGLRATLLNSTSDRIDAAVVVGMMSSTDGLLDHNVVSHTWMFFPPGWGRNRDWTELASARKSSPLLVQYNRDDGLFTLSGMKAAHEKLTKRYAQKNKESVYRGEFFPGPHKFDREMQESAFAWLKAKLKNGY